MRRLLRHRYVLPLALIAAAGLSATLSLGGAGADTTSPAGNETTTTAPAAGETTTTTPAATETTTTAPEATTISAQPTPISATGTPSGNTNAGSTARCPLNAGAVNGVTTTFNAGAPNSSFQLFDPRTGCLLSYGNNAIVYTNPPRSFIVAGQSLYATYCSSCHGPDANGPYGYAPNLKGLGPATIDFWVATGRMPADNTTQVQANRKPPKLSPLQALEVAAYVNSLDPATPFVPSVNVRGANLSAGQQLFTLNCAACHTITGAGDALAWNTFAPSLHVANATQIAEAIRTGPGNMPRFTGNLTDAQVRDIVAYVTQQIQHPTNPGGLGLGGIGPVAEGFVALLFGVAVLALVCFWIGDRA
jgi:ubiquinol-cytochrome c reductase cytochrome c subunit